MTSDPEATTLLREAVAQPFMVVRESPDEVVLYPEALGRWSRYLGSRFPLWSLHPWSYRSLNDTELPITHPLPTIVASIVHDEGLHEIAKHGEPVFGLMTMIDSRRYSLMQEEGPGWTHDHIRQSGEEFEIFNPMGFLRFPSALDGPVLSYYEPDSEHTIGGYISPYEEIGLELVRLLEQREAAPAGSPQRREAQSNLEEFLNRIAGSLPGRPPTIRDEAARRIVEEGARFIQLIWTALEPVVELHPLTMEILCKYVGTAEAAEEAAVGLVLPNLSAREVAALRRGIKESRRAPLGPVTPAHRFAMAVLAHRLRLPIGTVARKVTTGWNAEMVQVADECIVCGDVHRT